MGKTATFVLQRIAETPLSTRGTLFGTSGELLAQILERGAQNPAHKRIPAGTYQIGRKPLGASHFDGAFQKLLGKAYNGILWIPNVPGRSNIEIHTANCITQLEGCLATATDITHDANGDYMATASKNAYAKVYPIISAALDAGTAMLRVQDVGAA